MLLEPHGKGGALCEPAKLGQLHCPLILRGTSEDAITAHLVQSLRLVSPRHWVSDFLNAALGRPRFRRQVYRGFRLEPWVSKPPFPRDLIPWAEGGTEVDFQLTWENPPTTVFVEAKYGSRLSTRTSGNDGSCGYPGDQLVRNIRVGLHECGRYETRGLFDTPVRDFVVVVLAPERGHHLVQVYRNPRQLEVAIPQSRRIRWPMSPFVGEVGYGDIRKLLLTRRRLMTPTERRVVDGLLDYLAFKHQTRPHRVGLPVAQDTDQIQSLCQSAD